MKIIFLEVEFTISNCKFYLHVFPCGMHNTHFVYYYLKMVVNTSYKFFGKLLFINGILWTVFGLNLYISNGFKCWISDSCLNAFRLVENFTISINAGECYFQMVFFSKVLRACYTLAVYKSIGFSLPNCLCTIIIIKRKHSWFSQPISQLAQAYFHELTLENSEVVVQFT